MRLSLTLLASSMLLAAHAQTDISKMMGAQGRTTQSPGGIRMEDDNGPFVPNSFIGSFRMEIHTFKGTAEEKNSPANMLYWSSTDMTLTQMEGADQRGQRMRMLSDLKGKWTYMLMTDDKGKRTALKSRKKKVTTTAGKDEGKEPRITVTNETRTIEGHPCTKVIMATEDGTWTGWVAKDVEAPFRDMARNALSGNSRHAKGLDGMDGFPLEYEWVDTSGKERMVCHVRDLVVGKVDPAIFSLDGYEMVEMPSFGR